MTDPEIGKLWVPESADVVRQDILDDIRLVMREQGVTLPVSPKTDTYIWATADANAAMIQYSQLATLSRSITPLYSEGDDLERWRQALGLPVAEPGPSSGRTMLPWAPVVSTYSRPWSTTACAGMSRIGSAR